MAHFYVRNSLNYDKTVKINISFVRGYDVNANDGDPRWFLELATTETSASGTKIPPQYVNNITDEVRLDELVADAVAKLASQIEWYPLVEDKRAPYVYDADPYSVSTSVPIESNVNIVLKDDFPSSGMDLSDAVVTISTNGSTFDITEACTIEGTPFEYTIHWEPAFRRYEYNNGG